MLNLNESPVKGGKKWTKHLLHGNTKVVGVLSGREEIRESILILCLKLKLFFFFSIQNMFVWL